MENLDPIVLMPQASLATAEVEELPHVGFEVVAKGEESSDIAGAEMLPVQISKELLNEYTANFLPLRKPKGKNLVAQAMFGELLVYLHELSAGLNGLFAHLRGIAQGGYDTSMYSKEQLQDQFNRAAQMILSSRAKEDEAESIKQFTTILNAGQSHIIIPSKRYKEGYDIMFVGIPGSGTIPGSTASFMPRIQNILSTDSPTSWRTETLRKNLENELAQDCVACAATVLTKLFTRQDAGDAGTSHQRIYNTLPIDFDFDSLNNIALGKSGLKASTVNKFFGSGPMSAKAKALAQALNKYFSIVVVREAHPTVVREKLSSMRQDNTPGSADKIKAEDLMVKEVFKLQPSIGFTVAMHLPAEIVSYITQTPQGKQISLMALNTWASIWARAALKQPKQRAADKEKTIALKRVPRYVLPPSVLKQVAETRKRMGFYSEPGRINEDSLYIANNGRFQFCPPAEELNIKSAEEYEKTINETLQLSYAAGSPVRMGQQGVTDNVFALQDPNYAKNIKDLKTRLSQYSGASLGFSWDYNCMLGVSADPERVESVDLAGGAHPDALAISSYLTLPFGKALSRMLPSAYNKDGPVGKSGKRPVMDERDYHGYGSNVGFLDSSTFKELANYYNFMFVHKHVPSFSELVKEAAKELKITKLDDAENPEVLEIENGLYGKYIDKNLTCREDDDTHPFKAILAVLRSALNDARGVPQTNLYRYCTKHNEEVTDNHRHFNSQNYTLAQFKNVYTYLGGMVFYKALSHLAGLKSDILLKSGAGAEYTPDNTRPSYRLIVREVMPVVVFLTKYIPQAKEIEKQAEELKDTLTPDQSISAADIQVPGSVAPGETDPDSAGFSMFPHQVGAMQYLYRHPKFAVLDISAGGGKTIAGLTDIAELYNKKLINRPLIIAPNGLVKNWCDDLHKITGGRWNTIPITSLTYNSWAGSVGQDKLIELIKKAPRNTIVVVGMKFLATRPYSLVFGNYVSPVSSALEFIKSFGFDYVLVDEVHKAKNSYSKTHKNIKQLCTASTAKYIRLATGTLISNTLTDVVGQTALFSSHIFRTADEYETENKIKTNVGGKEVSIWRDDVPQIARKKLSEYAAVISFKRKNWAFMLPIPEEEFISVGFEEYDKVYGNAHAKMYEAVLNETLELIKDDKEVMGLLKGKKVKDEDDDSDDEDEVEDTSSDDPEDDDVLDDLKTKLYPYLQRLERILTDPLGDELGKDFFGNMNKNDFVSAKVRKVIERIKLHFVKNPWKKGQTYPAHTMVDVGDKQYELNLRAFKGMKEYTSNISPDQDPEHWRYSMRGKVLIFCRYTRSVSAIYRALPEELKKRAVTFVGTEKKKKDAEGNVINTPKQQGSGGERWANLAKFKNDPKIDILVANEQAIVEGQNLQVGGRLIRVEIPWAPGDLDQAMARIFRPDPSGKYPRETIYLDWILADGTMEVAKMGRLIWKMVSNVQFDEANNPMYDSVGKNEAGDPLLIPAISMSLDTLRMGLTLRDIQQPYIDEYQKVVSIQSSEFLEMRKTQVAKMYPIEPTPMPTDPKDSAILETVPYVPDQDVPDRHNVGLVKMAMYLEDDDTEHIRKDPAKLVGTYVHTEFGNGVVVNVSTARAGKKLGEEADDAEAAAGHKISRIHVQLANADPEEGLIKVDVEKCYVATNLDENTLGMYKPAIKWLSNKDKRMQARIDLAEQKRLVKEKQRLKLEKIAARKAGGKTPKVTAPSKKLSMLPEEEPEHAFEVFPLVYNEFLSLEVDSVTPEARSLKQYGFRYFGPYVFAEIKKAQDFEKFLEYVGDRFDTSPQTTKRLQALYDGFTAGRGRLFNVEQAPFSEFANFYNTAHKPVQPKKTGLPEIKLYPVVRDGRVMVVFDRATNPLAVRKLLNKTIPSTRVTFTEVSGMEIYFGHNKGELLQVLNKMVADGVTISNLREAKAEIAGMKLHQSRPDKPKTKEPAVTKKSPTITVKKQTKAPVKKQTKAPVKKAPTKVRVPLGKRK